MHRRLTNALLALVILLNALIAFAILGFSKNAQAQSTAQTQLAPGSDPIVITGKVSFTPLPIAKPPTSTPMGPSTDLPPSLQAKISRLEAMAYSALNGGNGTVQTGADVISTQTGNALQKTCTTNVASNTYTQTAGGVISPSGAPTGPVTNANQIAVLAGDLVTICK